MSILQRIDDQVTFVVSRIHDFDLVINMDMLSFRRLYESLSRHYLTEEIRRSYALIAAIAGSFSKFDFDGWMKPMKESLYAAYDITPEEVETAKDIKNLNRLFDMMHPDKKKG